MDNDREERRASVISAIQDHMNATSAELSMQAVMDFMWTARGVYVWVGSNRGTLLQMPDWMRRDLEAAWNS